MAFLPKIPYLDSHLEIELADYQPDIDRCVLGGPAMMMPKDQDELATWFNAAFNTLKSSYQYQDICDNLKDEHGMCIVIFTFTEKSDFKTFCSSMFKMIHLINQQFASVRRVR